MTLRTSRRTYATRALAFSIVLIAISLIAAANASAAVTTPTLYTAQGNNFASNLYTVDPATGATTVVGAIGMAITGMAYDSASGTLYGVTTPNSPINQRNLISIDTATGAATVIGPLDAGAGQETIAEIEFDGAGNLWGWSESGDHLVKINTATGALTDFPNFIGTAGDGMAWIPSSDTLWFMPNGSSGNYYTIDRTTGGVTLAGTLSGTVAGGQVSAAAQTCDGNTTFVTLNGNPSTLSTVSFATGVVTDVGSLGISTADALAWACPPPPAPPAPKPVVPPAPPLAVVAIGHGTVKRCTPADGTCRVPIKFSLNAAANVTLKITRQYGRKTKARCNTVNPEIRNKPVCTLNAPTYTKKLVGVAGANRYTFKVPRTATLGHYRFKVAATNKTGAAPVAASRFLLPWG